MNFLVSVGSGFCWGLGLIIACFVMKFVFHIGLLG